MQINVARDLRWNVHITPADGETWPVVEDSRTYRYRPLSLSLQVCEDELSADHTHSLKVWTGIRVRRDGSEGARMAVGQYYLPFEYVTGPIRVALDTALAEIRADAERLGF
jgi:hypothetical protein